MCWLFLTKGLQQIDETIISVSDQWTLSFLTVYLKLLLYFFESTMSEPNTPETSLLRGGHSTATVSLEEGEVSTTSQEEG